MSTFKKPLAGDPANLILSQSFQGALVDVVNAYNRGELTQKPQELRKQNVVMVKNQTDNDIEPGQALSVDQTMPDGSANLLVSYLNNPLVYGSAITWHDNICDFAVATQTIEAGLIGPAAFKPWGRVKADVHGDGCWLMHDPESPEQFKRTTGGVARVITADSATGEVVANFDEQQRLWRYELTEDVQNLVGVGNLIDLGGNVYASNTSFRFTNSTKREGDSGFCVHTGNNFDAIEAVPTAAGEPTPRFRFRLKTDFDDTGVATAYVLDVFGNVTNPDGSPVELGDILNVHDPRKCFAHAVGSDSLATIHAVGDPFFPAGGSVGYAVKTEQLKASPNDPDDPQYPRWEVEQCTQTVQRMKVQIDGRFSPSGSNDTQPTGELNEGSKRLFFNAQDAILSRWPDVDYAPEWTPFTEGEQYDWQIYVENPHRFSAGDGWAIIERVVNRSRVEDASNVDTPYSAITQGEVEWHIVDVQRPIARWLQVKWGSNGWRPGEEHAEGEDPAGAQVGYLFDDGGLLDQHIRTAPGLETDCLDIDEIGWAFWDMNQQYYNVIVTDSALMGAPIEIEPVATYANAVLPMAEFDGCDLTLRKLTPVKVFGNKEPCPITQDSETISPTLTQVNVMMGISIDPEKPTEVCFTTGSVYVCSGTINPEPICIDVCEPCDPQIGCCELSDGTYLPDQTLDQCNQQNGSWLGPGTECPDPPDPCVACDVCELCDGVILQPQPPIKTGIGADPNFAESTFDPDSCAMSANCKITCTGTWTSPGLPDIAGTVSWELKKDQFGECYLEQTANPATINGFMVDGWKLLGSGFQNCCDDGYGTSFGLGIEPLNGQDPATEQWDECNVQATCCTIWEVP